ncbi:MAG TPA: 30S ribosome-binding factor RbfA [Thermomicrobiales bacterium]|nr:30S ribosome-binding factor RbfA [Thermomicrobiales bacterium]
MTRRTRQVGELLKEELTDIIRKEVKDPRIGFMSITEVDVTPDLRQARVYVSVLSEDERQGTMDALTSAASFIRHHLKPRLRMRQIPTLEFRGDRSMEYAQHITETLREIQKQDAERSATQPSAGRNPSREGESS